MKWEGWIRFFLEGVAVVSREATETARAIVNLREECRVLVNQRLGRKAGNGLVVLESLFRQPIVTVETVRRVTELSQPAANALTNDLERIGLLVETTGLQRYRRFAFERYLQLFEERDQRG